MCSLFCVLILSGACKYHCTTRLVTLAGDADAPEHVISFSRCRLAVGLGIVLVVCSSGIKKAFILQRSSFQLNTECLNAALNPKVLNRP